MPGVTPGSYHAIVRTDIRNNIRESDISNNSLASTDTITVDVLSLQPGVPTIGTLTQGQMMYYRVDINANLDLRLTFDSDADGAANELYAAYGGGGLPTLRSRPAEAPPGAKLSCNFYFQVTHPDALAVGFEGGRSQQENVQAVIEDVLGHGNENCLLPGQIEAENAKKSLSAGGLLFTRAETEAFNELALEGGVPFNPDSLQPFRA